MKFYRKAADQGFARAETVLGEMYEKGHGVPQDYSEAMKWYQKAANDGDADGRRDIALLQEKEAKQKEDEARQKLAATGSPRDLRLVNNGGDLVFQWRGQYPITINRIVINKKVGIVGCDLSGTGSILIKFPFEL